MTVFERIENLRKSKGISQGKLEKELGFSNGSISKRKTSTPTPERFQKLADYFGVTMDYLLNGAEGELSSKDEKDIAKDMEALRDKLMSGEDGPASYDGEPIPEEDAELPLGHALLHRKENCYFIRNKTLLLTSKNEMEANRFAAELLIGDDVLLEYRDYTLRQISRLLGYHEKLLELKMG